MTPAVLKLVNNKNFQGQVAEYQDLKREAERIEFRMKQLKGPIEEVAIQAGGRIEGKDFTVEVVQCERENFSLSRARKDLDAKTFKILAPFISESKYNRLVIK